MFFSGVLSSYYAIHTFSAIFLLNIKFLLFSLSVSHQLISLRGQSIYPIVNKLFIQKTSCYVLDTYVLMSVIVHMHSLNCLSYIIRNIFYINSEIYWLD